MSTLKNLYTFDAGDGPKLLQYNDLYLGDVSVGGGSAYPTDYIAFYKFEDDLTDETGTYDAVGIGTGAGLAYETGKVDKCLYLKHLLLQSVRSPLLNCWPRRPTQAQPQ